MENAAQQLLSPILNHKFLLKKGAARLLFSLLVCGEKNAARLPHTPQHMLITNVALLVLNPTRKIRNKALRDYSCINT